MGEIMMRDRSRAGHALGEARVVGLPATATLGQILATRIRAEVADHNARPGLVFGGMVQPEDAIRHSDGHHLRSPRQLDGDRMLTAVHEAIAAGVITFQVGGLLTADIDHPIDVDTTPEIVAIMARPVVARRPPAPS